VTGFTTQAQRTALVALEFLRENNSISVGGGV